MNNPNPNHPFAFGNANQNPQATSSNSNNNLTHFHQQPNQLNSNTNLVQTSTNDFQKRAHKRKPSNDPNLQIQIEVPNLQQNDNNSHQQGNQVNGRNFNINPQKSFNRQPQRQFTSDSEDSTSELMTATRRFVF